MTADAVDQFVHDARGSLGSIRLSIGALLEEDEDPAFREVLLRGVEAELVRVVACLNALPVALIEPSPSMVEVDLVPTVRRAAQRADGRGLAVELFATGAPRVASSLAADVLESVLVSTLELAAGAHSDIVVRVDGATRELVISGGERWPMADHLMARLASLLGATLESGCADRSLRWHDG